MVDADSRLPSRSVTHILYGVSSRAELQLPQRDLSGLWSSDVKYSHVIEMGKYRVLRFEFPASSSPHFEFPAAENSVIRAENSILKVYLSCPLADNSVMLAENSDAKAHSSYPRSGELDT